MKATSRLRRSVKRKEKAQKRLGDRFKEKGDGRNE